MAMPLAATRALLPTICLPRVSTPVAEVRNPDLRVDTLVGDAGNDHLIGGGGSDVLYGSDDDDRLDGDYVAAPTGTWTLDTGASSGAFGLPDLLAQHVVDPASIHGADLLFGEGGNDELVGAWGDDTIDGGDGIDWLFGDVPLNFPVIPTAYQGADRLSGGAGDLHLRIPGGSWMSMSRGLGVDRQASL